MWKNGQKWRFQNISEYDFRIFQIMLYMIQNRWEAMRKGSKVQWNLEHDVMQFTIIHDDSTCFLLYDVCNIMLCNVMLCYVMYVERERVHLFARKNPVDPAKKCGSSPKKLEQVPKGKWAGNPWVFYISDPVLGHRMHMPRGQPTSGTLRYSPFHFLLAQLQVAYIFPMLTHFKPLKSRSETSWICLFGGMDSLVNRYAKTKKSHRDQIRAKTQKIIAQYIKNGWLVHHVHPITWLVR
jgi:hypothetical protein